MQALSDASILLRLLRCLQERGKKKHEMAGKFIVCIISIASFLGQ